MNIYSKKKKGISLIALIIMIIVIIILAGAILLALANNNPITSATEATILSSIGSVQGSLDLYRLQVMAETYEAPTVSDLVDANKILQLGLGAVDGSNDLYNVIIIEELGLSGSLGANADTRTELKDVFVLDVNDYVIYVDSKGKLYPDNNADIAIEPVGPVYTEDTLPAGFIPIYTVEQFNNISSGTNNYEIINSSGVSKGTFNMTSDATYVLMNDIDFSSISNQTPIKNFTGTFEGNRYSVKNITMDTTTSVTDYVSVITGLEIDPPGGLFDRVTNGSIQNLTIDNMNLTGVGSLGALMGENTGTTITSCKVINSNITSNQSPLTYQPGSAGGLIGFINNSPVTINKVKIISTNISGDNSSGIVATSFGDLTITSSRVESVTAEFAGYVGFTDGTLDMTSCKSIKTNSPVGMVYISKGNTTLTNCESSNIKASIAGIVYQSDGIFTATNCKVLNSNIDDTVVDTSKIPYYDSIGGIITLSNSQAILNGCEINGTTIKSNNVGIIGGLIGLSNDNVSIVNSNASNTTITNSGSCTAGIIALGTSDLEVSNCKVVNLTLNTSSDAAGIAAVIHGDTTITSSSISKMKVNGSYGTLSGIIAIAGGDSGTTTITNCTVNDFETTSGSWTTAGIIGVASHNLTIDNCTVSNSKLLSDGLTGGIVAIASRGWGITDADLSITNCNIINSTISGSEVAGMITIASLNNLTIDNCKVTDVTVTGTTTLAGGIVSVESNIVGETLITNCHVKNFNIIEPGEHTAGIIAIASKNLTIDKCSVTDANLVSRGQYGNGLSGGIIGVASKGWSGGPFDISVTNCNVVNSTISAVDVGGIVGIVNYDTALFQRCNVINSTVVSSATSNSYSTIVGGIVGAGSPDIFDCNVTNTTVTDKPGGPSTAIVGGVIASSNDSSTIRNVNVTNSKVESHTDVSGGIIAIGDTSIIENCTVTGTQILSGGDAVGGIAGILGGYGTPKIENCSVFTSTISTNGSFAGGIIGISGNTPIINCTVSNSTLTTNSTNTGGIAGFGFNIRDCIVRNSTITDNNTTTITTPLDEHISLTGLGGIVGHGSNFASDGSVITNCQVIDSILKGCDAVGGISGAANPNISDCSVSGTSVTGVGKFVGGIQGFGGSLTSNSLAVRINNCTVSNSQLVGISSVNYILGHNSYYPADSTVPVGDRLTDVITNSTYTNTTIN